MSPLNSQTLYHEFYSPIASKFLRMQYRFTNHPSGKEKLKTTFQVFDKPKRLVINPQRILKTVSYPFYYCTGLVHKTYTQSKPTRNQHDDIHVFKLRFVLVDKKGYIYSITHLCPNLTLSLLGISISIYQMSYQHTRSRSIVAAKKVTSATIACEHHLSRGYSIDFSYSTLI